MLAEASVTDYVIILIIIVDDYFALLRPFLPHEQLC